MHKARLGYARREIVSRETCADLSFLAAAGTKRPWKQSTELIKPSGT